MWTPSNGMAKFDFKGGGGGLEGQSTEQMKEDEQFPLLFESSSFYHSSPIVHDVEGDGVADAILGDYDGNLHFVGLDFEHDSNDNGGGRRRRYYKRVSIPRLYVRKSWYEVAINRTREDESMALVDETEAAKKNHTKWKEFEPYHTYFAGISDTAWRGPHDEEALRGVSGDVLNMDLELSRQLVGRKKKKVEEVVAAAGLDESHRRLAEDEPVDGDNAGEATDVMDAENEQQPEDIVEEEPHMIDEYMYEEPELFGDDSMDAPPDGSEVVEDKEPTDNIGDDYFPNQREDTEEGEFNTMDDMYARPPLQLSRRLHASAA